MPRLFVYGTLLDPAVLGRVIGRDPGRLGGRPATAEGWCRLRVKGRSYPTLRRAVGQSVAGRLITGLTATDLARLGRYEGPEYRLADIDATLDDGTRCRVRAYVTRPGVPVDDTAWSPEP